MNLITQNPYRVLGLLGNSSERELQKQIATIKRYAEVGKTKQFDYDYDFFGKVSRTEKDVQKASSQIEQANNKLHYSLFWFINKSHIDETALNHLKENNPDKAVEIWEKTIKDGEVTPKNFSSITNLATLLLGVSIQNGKLEKTKFQRAIDLKGKLIHSETFSDFVALTTGNGFSVDSAKISTVFTEDILTITKKYIDKEGGISNAELIQSFGSFPESTRKYLASKFIEGPQHNIESQIDSTVERRKSEPEKANKWGSALYAATRNDLSFLKKVLGAGNVQYQMLANKLANELLQCAIDYFIEWRDDYSNDPGQESLRVAKFAKSIATSGQTKDRIEENIENIEEWIANSEDRRLNGQIGEAVEYIIEKLNATVEVLNNKGKYPKGYDDPYSDLPKSEQPHNKPKTEAEDRLSELFRHTDTMSGLKENEFNINIFRVGRDIVKNCKPKLEQIKSAVGSEHEVYTKLSNDVANISLACLIEYVNNSGNSTLGIAPNISEHVINAMNTVGTLDMKSDLRKRYNEQKQSLANLKRASERRTTSGSSSSGGGCYIATMAYGDYDHPQVMTLRKFRDEKLATAFIGKALIQFYYATSPKMVTLLKNQKQINRTIRLMLDQIIKLIKK